MLKPTNYQMAIVTKVIINDLEEVTAVEARKGKNREVVKRHVNSIIPLLTGDCAPEEDCAAPFWSDNPSACPTSERIPRTAAQKCRLVNKRLCDSGHV